MAYTPFTWFTNIQYNSPVIHIIFDLLSRYRLYFFQWTIITLLHRLSNSQEFFHIRREPSVKPFLLPVQVQ